MSDFCVVGEFLDEAPIVYAAGVCCDFGEPFVVQKDQPLDSITFISKTEEGGDILPIEEYVTSPFKRPSFRADRVNVTCRKRHIVEAHNDKDALFAGRSLQLFTQQPIVLFRYDDANMGLVPLDGEWRQCGIKLYVAKATERSLGAWQALIGASGVFCPGNVECAFVFSWRDEDTELLCQLQCFELDLCVAKRHDAVAIGSPQ